jgi:L-malate glycosyltransferase
VGLIHAHQYSPFFYAAMGRWAAGRIPVLFTEHGRCHPDFPRRKRIVANRLLLGRGDRVLAVGRAVRGALIANEGIPAERIEVIYNGIDLEAYRDGQSQREATRRQLGLADDDVAVIQVARLDSLKDHPTAVAAMAELAPGHPRARLLIVGEGAERARIEAAVRERGVSGSVRLVGLRTDVPRLLSAADVFLLTSISEGIPLTLIEAMAAGLPCVSTRVGGIPEVVVDGETGVLAEPSKPESVAAALGKLVADASLRRRLGEAGRGRALRLFDDQAMHAAYDRIYRQMLGQDGRNG